MNLLPDIASCSLLDSLVLCDSLREHVTATHRRRLGVGSAHLRNDVIMAAAVRRQQGGLQSASVSVVIVKYFSLFCSF